MFKDYFDIVEDYYDNYDFVPDEFVGSEEDAEIQAMDLKFGIDPISQTTLDEFIEDFKNQGVFLVSLAGNPKAKHNASKGRECGHIVCVQCVPGKRQGFIDTWDCSEMLIDAYMRVKNREPVDSPNHWKYDRVKKQFIV